MQANHIIVHELFFELFVVKPSYYFYVTISIYYVFARTTVREIVALPGDIRADP